MGIEQEMLDSTKVKPQLINLLTAFCFTMCIGLSGWTLIEVTSLKERVARVESTSAPIEKHSVLVKEVAVLSSQVAAISNELSELRREQQEFNEKMLDAIIKDQQTQ